MPRLLVSEKTLLPLAMVLSLLAYLTNVVLQQQDALTPASAPATEFSGARARALLDDFLAEDVAHPVGTAENQRVKRRIQAWLDAQGIAHEEQGAWACRENSRSCAYVENIIAQIPGKVEAPFVAMMAHYDSVPTAAGAGDDMAGVVAVLEAARAAKAVGGLRHPLLLIITDAEETGLHGAEAFFRQHELAQQVGVLLNLEGSGTQGVSQVLRTSMANAWTMKLFAAQATQPAGTSLANEVFKRMPNDTDFSVAMEARIPGIDFAFVGERNHYHTPNDSAAMLDPRTIQHHGDNLFPLVLALANDELDAPPAGSVLYATTHGQWWQWPEGLTPWLLALAVLLLIASSARSDAGFLPLTLASTLVPITVFLSGGALTHLVFALLDAVHGSIVSWPAHPWAFRAVVVLATMLPTLLLARWLSKRLSVECLLLGAWWFVAGLTTLLVLYLRDAASIFLVGLLPAALLLAVAAWLPLRASHQRMLQLGTVIFAVNMLHVAVALETSQGYGLLVAIWPWIALFAVGFLAFARGPWLSPVTRVAFVALLAAGAMAFLLPRFSELRPQHLNVLYLQESEGGSSVVHLQSRHEIPKPLLATADLRKDSDYRLPWDPQTLDQVAPVANAGLPSPQLTVEDNRAIGSGREVRLRLSSQRGAWRLRLILPPDSGLVSATVAGNPVYEATTPSGSASWTGLAFYGVQTRDVHLVLQLRGTEPVDAFLADTTPALPPVAKAVSDKRPKTATPQHTGDRATVFKPVRF